METLLQDIRMAVRQFVRRPGFAAVAIGSLALALGGNALIVGIVDGFVLRPFPYPEADRLVAIGVTFPKLSSDTGYVEVISPAEYAEIRESRAFAHVGAFDLGNRNISGGDVPERVFTALLLDDLFPVIGMAPQLGRGFTAEELAPRGRPAAIISDRLWRTRFGSDPGIVNRTIRIGGEATPVVGVMPPGLVLIGTDLWIPWGGSTAAVPRNVRQFTVLGRLAPGASLSTARASLATIAGQIEQTNVTAFKEYAGWQLTPTPFAAALLQDVRPAAFLLLAATVFVLLIACTNLANLFLARATSRQREIAVRLALGAARWRLARHVLAETTLLALAGAAGGLFLAFVGLQFAPALVPDQFRMLDLHAVVNTRVVWWSTALALGTGLLTGLLPAWHAMRTDPHGSLKADARTGTSRGAGRLRAALVVAEIALSVALLLGAGLLVRSFDRLQRVDPGFEARGVLTMRLTLPRERYPADAANAFFDALVERISSVPGVSSVSAASQFPPQEPFDTQFAVEGQDAGVTTLPSSLITVATPAYLSTLRVPLRGGRPFAAGDRLDTDPVAIVNESFARRYLPDTDPIGRRISIGPPDARRRWTTIVGVVGDYHNRGLAQPVRPEILIPMRQQVLWNQLFLLVRAEGAPEALLPLIREAVAALDPEQPIYSVQTLEAAMATASFQQRVAAVLLTIFAILALSLAAIGIYGVMSYTISARTQEMGVRLAVGAQRRDVLWLVFRQVLWLSVAGLSIGTGLVLAGGRALQGLLFGVTPSDPVTLAVATVVLTGIALLAAWGPASRASRVDPIQALRYE